MNCCRERNVSSCPVSLLSAAVLRPNPIIKHFSALYLQQLCIVLCFALHYTFTYLFSLHSIVLSAGERGYCDRSHNRFYRPLSIWPPEYLSTNLSRRKKNTDFNLLLAELTLDIDGERTIEWFLPGTRRRKISFCEFTAN